MTSKTEFRKFYKKIRNNILDIEIKTKSNLINAKLYNNPRFLKANNIFIYCSYGREVPTDDIIELLFKSGKRILIPKCDIESETMIAVELNPDSEFTENIYGIKEISGSCAYNGKIDLIIVPGLAFDKYGNRIGYGKGYYDKFLNDYDSYTIGLCYSECLSDVEIPHDANDKSLNCIITDREELIFQS